MKRPTSRCCEEDNTVSGTVRWAFFKKWLYSIFCSVQLSLCCGKVTWKPLASVTIGHCQETCRPHACFKSHSKSVRWHRHLLWSYKPQEVGPTQFSTLKGEKQNVKQSCSGTGLEPGSPTWWTSAMLCCTFKLQTMTFTTFKCDGTHGCCLSKAAT